MGLETLNNLGVKHPFKAKYDNYIGGKFVPPVDGKYLKIFLLSQEKYSAKLHDQTKKM